VFLKKNFLGLRHAVILAEVTARPTSPISSLDCRNLNRWDATSLPLARTSSLSDNLVQLGQLFCDKYFDYIVLLTLNE